MILRQQKISLLGALFAGALLFTTASDALAQRDFSKVQIMTIPLGGAVSMLMGAGGNIGVVSGDDGVFMIDDQFAPLTPKILAAVKKINPKPNPAASMVKIRVLASSILTNALV